MSNPEKHIEIQYRGIGTLSMYEKNPRKNDKAVRTVVNSIREFGFKVPIIIDDKSVIVAGHTRYKAAMQLGITAVPCVIADDLTPEQVKAFRLADNKTGEIAEWDEALLAQELAELESIGFDMLAWFDPIGEAMQPEAEEHPKVPFTEEVLEEHNYVVLYFDNEIDWLQAQSVFNIGTVEGFSTKKDGNGKRRKFGVGRVIRGAEFLKRITEGQLMSQ